MFDLSTGIAEPARYGWKAHYLSLLAANALSVPVALALAPDEAVDLSALDPDLSYAVRSSGLAEDSQSASYAGRFTTHLGVRGLKNLLLAIEDVRADGADEMPMGVVVQQMVDRPIVSGVAFSCHPVTFDRHIAPVSWIHGVGDRLVSGMAAGNDMEVRLTDGVVSSGDWPLEAEFLRELTDVLIRLDQLLDQPVDVEWCIAGRGGLHLLQLRPVVLPAPAVSDLDTMMSFQFLPHVIATHRRLALRADAVRLGVPMLAARAVLASHSGGMPDMPPFKASEQSAGRSVVLLHPSRIDGKSVSKVTKDCSTDVEFFVQGCQRYAIRQYPDPSDAARSIVHALRIGLEHGALACVLEQEILEAYATGILRRTAEGYLIEAALGHFVPKGVVETSTFLLSFDLRVILRSEVLQSAAYHFINGHIVAEQPPYEPLSLTDVDLHRVVSVLKPILAAHPAAAWEFGLVGEPGHRRPYIIDIVDDDLDADQLLSYDVTRGVVSSGSAAGPVVDLRRSPAREVPVAGPAIYIARQAFVDILPLVRACHPSSGFIFESASLLAHLSVALRERGLAAVRLPASSIDDLVREAGSLAIDTAKQEMVTQLKMPQP